MAAVWFWLKRWHTKASLWSVCGSTRARFPIAYAELGDDTLCGVPLDEGEQVMMKRLVSMISDHLFDGWVHDPASFARHIERSDELAAATEALKGQRTVGALTEQEFRLRAGELASAYRRGASQR